MIEFGAEFKGLQEYRRALRRLERGLKDLRPVFRGVAAVFRSRTALTFRNGTDPAGAAWPEHSDRYRRYRGGRVVPKPYQKLVDTGRLRASFSAQISRNSLAFGTNVIYAPTHQFGDPDRNIPPRPFLPLEGLPPAWAGDVDKVVDRHLERISRG